MDAAAPIATGALLVKAQAPLPPVFAGVTVSGTLAADYHIVPYEVIWRGITANTICYAAIWIGIWQGYILVRRRRRAHRRCCPRCNYHLGGAFEGGCPECGWRREAKGADAT